MLIVCLFIVNVAVFIIQGGWMIPEGYYSLLCENIAAFHKGKKAKVWLGCCRMALCG